MPIGSKEVVRSPETAIIDSCDLPHGFWEPNMGFLQSNSVLNLVREPFLQVSVTIFNVKIINPRSFFKRKTFRHHLKTTISESMSKEMRDHSGSL